MERGLREVSIWMADPCVNIFECLNCISNKPNPYNLTYRGGGPVSMLGSKLSLPQIVLILKFFDT